MKNYFKRLGINWTVVIAFGILIVVAIFINQCDRYKYEKELRKLKLESAEKLDSLTKTSIEAKKLSEEANLKGDTVVIFERAQPVIEMIELRVEDKRKVDSLAKINNINVNKISSLTTIIAEAKAHNLHLQKLIAANGKDTVLQYKDKYITNTIYKRDSSYTSDVWLDASVNKIDYTKKTSWFFGEDQYLSKVWFNSPYIKPDGMDYLEVKQKDKFFDWGISAEGRYLHTDKEIMIGPKANIRLGRITLNGGYGVNTKEGKGQFWYGTEYKIK